MIDTAVAQTLQLTPAEAQAAAVLADYFRPQLQAEAARKQQLSSVSKFSAKRFFIPETGRPLQLMPHQSAILEYALDPNHPFTDGGTVIYSTIKKSGKTALASLVARYISECWGTGNEVYCLASDQEQARGRSYQKLIDSIELDPTYSKETTRKSQQNNVNGWKIIERQAYYEPNRSFVRAVSSDYRGEAGSNPTATFFTELWTYTSQASRRLWDELTPVPTRARSVRWVETYAGFTDESDLLLDLYQLGLDGRQLTHDDIDWPFSDQPPIYVNERARLLMYWDTGILARRMPWQVQSYYDTQAATLTQSTYERLHENKWVSSITSFIPIEWWEACRTRLPPITPNEPLVLSVDAGITNDCFALVLVSRNPDPTKQDQTAIRAYDVWYPTQGAPMDFLIAENRIRELCATYNIVEICYDQYQLHDMMTRLSRDAIAWCRPFSQASVREVADKALYDTIRDKRIAHDTGPEFTAHVKAAAKKQETKDRLRIVKKGDKEHVDLLVAASMGAFECERLNL